MGLFLPLIVSLLFISSSHSNPISLDRAAPWPSGDRGILEQDAPETTQLSASDKLTCENSGAERCLLFPIGCVPGVNCTDRLEMRKVQSGNIIISLNLHVSRTAHMLVAVPMPDLSNPNSTFLVGCSIDDAVAVVAKPDVDGVTEQLRLDWLNLVAVRATSDDLECIVSAQPGFIDLPQGDIAVFAGDLEPEEEIGQSARISGSLDDGSEEEREGEKSRDRIHVESSIHKISPPLIHERTTQSLEHSESTEPILVSVEDQAEPVLTAIEDQGPSTTQMPEKTTVAISSKANKLRLKMLHSSENSSGERAHRHSSAESTHSTHASVHHESTSTTTTTEKTTTTSTEAPTEAPEVEKVTDSTTETPSTQTPEQSTTTTKAVKEEDTPTTVHPPHHTTHHHEHHKEQTHHSHERATVDKEHHSVRMEPVRTTTTERPKTFEDDKDLPEEDKKILRELQAGHVKEERRDGEEEEEEDEETTHADGTEHHKHATVYELTREAAQDPIGRRPSEHSHSHNSHSHSHEHRTDDDGEEEKKEKHTTKKPVHKHKEEEEGGEEEDEEIRQKMGEKKHYRRSEEDNEEEDDDEDDSSSAFSLIVPMIIILAPVILY